MPVVRTTTMMMSATRRRFGHSVRVILREDLPHGKGYGGDVVSVKAGYARNHLVPQKLALYATPDNFRRLNMVDPGTQDDDDDVVSSSSSQPQQRDTKSKEQLDADLLRKYLHKKILKLSRNADLAGNVHPGMVDARAVRTKLSKHLKIDLEEHEHVRIHPFAVNFTEVADADVFLAENLLLQEEEDPVQVRQLGDYLARIDLAGGFSVPLRFTITKR